MSTTTVGQAYNYKVVRQFVVATLIRGRRVELATGKTVKAVAPQEPKPGWGHLEL